jgi:hypothetical protein
MNLITLYNWIREKDTLLISGYSNPKIFGILNLRSKNFYYQFRYGKQLFRINCVMNSNCAFNIECASLNSKEKTDFVLLDKICLLLSKKIERHNLCVTNF